MTAANPRARGFTLVEVMVAIAVAALLFGICVSFYVLCTRLKRRSEQLLVLHQDAAGILRTVKRDIEGLYVSGTAVEEYYRVEASPGGADCGQKLTVVTATENPGKADYCTISYYVKRRDPADPGSGVLYRVLSGGQPPDGGWSLDEEDWVLAEGVRSIRFEPDSDSIVDGKVPTAVTVRLRFHDSGGPETATGDRLPHLFVLKILPGAEEY